MKAQMPVHGFFTSGQVCALLDIPQRTLDSWARAGIVQADIPARGPGCHRLFSLVPVLAIAIGRSLRATGASLAIAGDITEFLTSLSHENLSSAFAAGRTHIMIAGDKVLPRLLPLDAIKDNPGITEAAAQAREDGIDVVAVAVVDIKGAYDRLCSKLEKLIGDRPKAQSRRVRRPA